MKFRRRLTVIFLGCCLFYFAEVQAWGVWGHQHINKAVVFALPSEMLPFFYNHVDFFTETGTVPDILKYTIGDKEEYPRHFCDIEEFQKPDDSIPQKFRDAYQHYDTQFLVKNGILPWYIQEMEEKLTLAFKQKKKTEIIFVAAELGHYLGDAHMPLHTCVNHDGQLTNQRGIHSCWEAQLPELFGSGYNFNCGKAKYIDDIPKETWRIINDSHYLSNALLATEKEIRAQFGDSIFAKDSTNKVLRNKYNQPVYAYKAAKAWHDRLNGMVEKQLRASILATASFCYTAWVNAGKPDLNDLDDTGLTKRNKKNLNKELNEWKKGKLIWMKTFNEY